MVTISEEIKKIVARSPFLEEGILQGIINLSALSRNIKPELEQTLLKPVSESAILMALKRFSDKLQKNPVQIAPKIKNRFDLTVRSNLCEYTFQKSETILSGLNQLLTIVKDHNEQFITFSQGIYEITVISSSNLKDKITDVFKNEKQITFLDNLSAITIKLTPEIVSTPGTHYSILKQLAWNNINIVEVVSTFTEFSIIIKRESVDKAFSILLNYLS